MKSKLFLFCIYALYADEDIKLKLGNEVELEYDDIFNLQIAYIGGNRKNEEIVMRHFTFNNQNQWEYSKHLNTHYTGSVEVTMQGSLAKAMLIISNVMEADEGYYRISVNHNDGKPDSTVYNVIILKPPMPMTLESMPGALEGVESDVAKCTAVDAKPAAKVIWESSDKSIEKQLNNISGDSESILKLTLDREDNGKQITCKIMHEIINDSTNYNSEWTRSFVVAVRYAPGPPKISLVTESCDTMVSTNHKLKCEDAELKANPSVETYEWELPNGEMRMSQEIILMANSVDANQIVKCRTANAVDYGNWTTKSIESLNIEACPSSAGPAIVIIIVIGILILILLLVIFYLYRSRKLCFKDDEGHNMYADTQYSLDKDADYGYSKNNGVIDYQPNEEIPTAPTTKPPFEDDSDDENDGEPLVSSNNAEYHKQRRLESNLRHSPSRASLTREDDYALPPDQFNSSRSSHATDYDPNGRAHYASLNKEKLGVRPPRTTLERKSPDAVVYTELSHSGPSSFHKESVLPSDEYV